MNEGPRPLINNQVNFVLPSNAVSGGVRVTVEMAHQLLQHSIPVRIVVRNSAGILEKARQCIRQLISVYRRDVQMDWFKRFDIPVGRYRESLEEIEFNSGDIVIAVGSMVIKNVWDLKQPVTKIRYCHGFSEHNETLMNAWRYEMPTIAVSPILIDRLQSLSAGSILGVVPNGIHLTEYYIQSEERKGIGAIFNPNPKKAPEDLLELFSQMARRHPSIPLYMFGSVRRPKNLDKAVDYYFCPSIEKARQIYNRCLVWVVVSKSEGFCLPILEAMACGTAVVSSDHDTVSGLIRHGYNGLIVPIGDIERYIEAIEDILNQNHLRKKLVSEGEETVKNFSWAKASQDMITILQTYMETRWF